MSSYLRLIRSLKHLNRWRQVPVCFNEFERPTWLVANYLGLSRMAEPVAVRHRSGLRFQISEFGDVETIWQIFVRKVYDVRPTDRFIVDAGGNVGLFSCYALLRASQSHVLAIEPFPTTVGRLRLHLAENGLSDRVTVLERALAATPGNVAMPLNANNSQQRSVLHHPTPRQAAVNVTSTTLSEAIEKLPNQIDLLKMDIEGSEFEVLNSTPHETLRRFRRINVEHHEPPAGTTYTKAGLIAHLEKAGFAIRQHAGEPGGSYGVIHCEQQSRSG